jgi:hypothetical protein
MKMAESGDDLTLLATDVVYPVSTTNTDLLDKLWDGDKKLTW